MKNSEKIEMIVSYGNITHGYYISDNYFIYHRDEKDGPALIFTDGRQEWWINDKRHREDGPALIFPDGRQQWFIDDKLHREDGPAIIYPSGTHEWWINDIDVTDEVEKWLTERNINPDNMTEEDKLALTFFMQSCIK